MTSNHGQKHDMPYVRLGKSGLKVSRIILGCMSYGSPEWQPWVLGEEEGIKHIKAAYDLGINTFDTANEYSNGLSEEILGKAIRQHNLPRDEIVVLTKVFFAVAPTPVPARVMGATADAHGYANQHGLSRKHIFDSVKHSLRRLQLDYIDVLQCHRFDYDTPIAETMQALHDVVKAGYVRYIGMSSCFVYQFWQMQTYALEHHLTPFISLQNHWNLIYREEEREMQPTLKHFGIGAIPYSPLGRGFLTRPWRSGSARQAKDGLGERFYGLDHAESEAIVGVVAKVAQAHGATMAQVALAWLLSKDAVAAPIVGTTNIESLKDLVGATQLKLTPEEIKELEEPYKPRDIIGHW